MALLRAENGPNMGTRYPLESGQYVLGRHPDCDIVIDVGAVSRHHCKVFSDRLDFYVEDLHSRNGTFVNEQPVEARKKLSNGDRVRVCDVIFTFFAHASETPPSTLDESSSRAVLVDDVEASSSTIMSKLDVVSGRGGPQLAATPEAKLNALMEITQSLARAISLDEVLPQLLDSLFRIFMQADRGFVGLVDDRGVLAPRWTKMRRKNRDETIRVSRTIARQVMDTREAILSADAATDVRFEMSQSIADFRIRSVMCAPLLDREGKPLGILQLDTLDQRQRFQDEDLELLVSAAAQASIAIINARLHDDAMQRRTWERDLELAREVQRAFLPNRRPDCPKYDFFDYYRAANQIGGDYYDYVRLPDGRLAVLVADVVGHGVAAAMLMAKLSAEARFSLASSPHPASAITTLNERMCNLNLNRFVTCVMAVLDPATDTFTIANAGHMAPMRRAVDGTIDEPSRAEAGPPLGVVEGHQYGQACVNLQPGESLVMYTDGLNEAMDTDGKCFSIGRLRELIRESSGTPDEIGQHVLESIHAHMGRAAQEDDMCLVALQRIAEQ
jgi:serine phosphatase RsbU (regulator of sigma subunit)/pSer/pThr/pTyr-binding forkhead associated (FHA) protein